eukprot:12016_1
MAVRPSEDERIADRLARPTIIPAPNFSAHNDVARLRKCLQDSTGRAGIRALAQLVSQRTALQRRAIWDEYLLVRGGGVDLADDFDKRIRRFPQCFRDLMLSLLDSPIQIDAILLHG